MDCHKIFSDIHDPQRLNPTDTAMKFGKDIHILFKIECSNFAF